VIPAELLKRIDKKLEILQRHRPLSPPLVRRLKENFSLEMTYNSNAIEGNRLTLKETVLVIQEGITVKGKSLKDHLEAKNHFEAIQYLYELIEEGKRHSISEHLIRSLQSLVIKDIESDGGSYRKGNVVITGSSHRPPEAYDVPKLMRDLIEWIKKSQKTLHPIRLAALAHHRLVYIHPFDDGNGRTARLFMNLLLMQNGYPLVVILKNDRKKYYQALEKADRGKTDEIEKLIAQAVERSMNTYLKAIDAGSNKKERLQKLSDLAKRSPFSEKYLNLLARSGKLEAQKEGRLWMSSEQALKDYLASRQRKR
jgi:Fic family protein